MTVQSSRKSKSKQKDSISPLVVGIAVTVLVLFIGWLGWHFVGPGSKPVNGALQGLDPRWMVQKAQDSQGDIDKLSPDDRQQLVSRWGEATARAMWQGEYQMAMQHQAMARQPHAR